MELFKLLKHFKNNNKNMTGGSIGTDSDKEKFNNICLGYDYFPSIHKKVNRIIVIGDLHGDYDITIQTLILAGLIDTTVTINTPVDKIKWIGGDTFVVQVGDQIDRCRPTVHLCNDPRATANDEPSDIKIMELFTYLDKQARSKNGIVYSLLGNHELLNVMGNMNYVSYEGLQQFNTYRDPNDIKLKFNSGLEARQHAFAQGNEYGKFLGCTRVSAVIIGSFLFVHAGILPSFSDDIGIIDNNGIMKINQNVREWLVKKINSENIDQIVDSSNRSLFWTRIFGSIPSNVSSDYRDCQKYLEPTLKMFNVGNMVIGHTPQFYTNNDGMNSTCDRKLWRVDNGASGAFDKFDNMQNNQKSQQRNVQVLEILNDKQIKVLR